MAKSDIYVAKQSFWVGSELIQGGITRVRAGHELLKGREHLFELLDVHYDVESATAAPGQKRQGGKKKKDD